MKNLVETVEAIIFAAGKPISRADILGKLPEDVSRKNLNDAIAALETKYGGESGVLLLTFNDKIQFSSNPVYGGIVAEVLQPVKERELSQSLLEVLAIIAYKQPVTRLDIEEIRNVQSCDYQIGMLLRAGLIEVAGRRDTVGKPLLYGTTDEFLKKFQLHKLAELPDYDEVLTKIQNKGIFVESSENLFRTVTDLPKELDEGAVAAADFLDDFMDTDETPDFLKGSDFKIIE